VDLGCSVDVAQDGNEAVAKARAIVYDLVLLDMQMPGLDGMGAARAIRALPEHGHTPIVALTANALVDDHQHAGDATMNAWLRKPVTGAMLRAELGNWLAHSPDPGARAASSAGGPCADRPWRTGPGLTECSLAARQAATGVTACCATTSRCTGPTWPSCANTSPPDGMRRRAACCTTSKGRPR